MEAFSDIIISAARWVLPVLSVWLLARCMASMLREKYEPELWAWLETSGGETAAIRHWECIIGRAKGCDIVIDREELAPRHAALIRDSRGVWTLYSLAGGDALSVGGRRDEGDGITVATGDKITLAGEKVVFRDLSEKQIEAAEALRSEAGGYIRPGVTLFLLTVIQLLLVLEFSVYAETEYVLPIALSFAALIAAQWCYFLLMRAINRSGFEPETLAFYLSTLGLAVAAGAAPEDMLKQLLLLFAGIFTFIVIGWFLRDLGRAKAMRWPVGIAAAALLALNVLMGETVYGATNWISIGGVTLQPSEFVKVAYVWVSAATLDRLFRSRNLFFFIGFSAAIVGALALMGDFGSAVVFFAAFLIISFMRSGSFATVFLAIASAVLAGFLVLTVKPYIATRFAAWGHVWDDPWDSGWQQTRALSAAASGGLLGVGAGNGWLKDIFAADTDLVFCLLCEELGLIVAFCAMLALLALTFFAVRNAAQGRSSFFVIAAVASAAIMLAQLALNVFGCVDILPFTGVTFPFVSRGGSSLISCWGLLAFIKASDTRRGGSFTVRLPVREAHRRRSEK